MSSLTTSQLGDVIYITGQVPSFCRENVTKCKNILMDLLDCGGNEAQFFCKILLLIQ